MATYVVTGGAGFIGSHISEELVRLKHTVRIVDNFYSGKDENIAGIRSNVEVFRQDIAEAGKLNDIFKGADYVIHQAAIPSVPRSILILSLPTAPMLTARSTCLSRQKKPASSALSMPLRPRFMEKARRFPSAKTWLRRPFLRTARRNFSPRCIAAFLHGCMASRQCPCATSTCLGRARTRRLRYSGVFAKFIPAVLQDRVPSIYGDGLQSRDFTYVANVVAGNLLACTVPGIGGEVFNVACGGRITLNSVLEQINRITGRNVAANYAEPRKGDIKHSQADIEKATSLMGYRPQVSFEDGLKKTVEWYRENLPQAVSGR